MLPGVKVLPVETEVCRKHAAKYARLYKKVLQTAEPLAETPEFAIVFQHDAQVAKGIFEKEISVHQQRLTSFPDRAAYGDEDVESNRFVLCFLDPMPKPERCHMILQDFSRTLVDEDVENLVKKVLDQLKKQYNALLR